MASTFTGVKVVDTDPANLNLLYKEKKLVLDTTEYPNQFIVFKAAEHQSALVRVQADGHTAKLINQKLSASGIKPRNKEQFMALDMLMDDTVPVCVITGKAGSGKTLCTLAAALQKQEEGVYKKIIITRPMSQVGRYDLGSLPGTVDEKFKPYLGNFETNLSQLAGKDIEFAMERYGMECVPIQLMRGCSFKDTFIIADEVQVLPESDMLTIGTRVGENSKIVILGDLDQRDAKIAKTATGLYKLMNSTIAKESALVGAIELLKCERSATSALFANIFETTN